jgi:hypothetical protein
MIDCKVGIIRKRKVEEEIKKIDINEKFENKDKYDEIINVEELKFMNFINLYMNL